MTKCDFMTKRLNILNDEDEEMKKLIEQGYTKIESELGKITGFRILHDNVNYPSHYQGKYGLESIDVLRNFMTPEMLKGFYLGNALKYQLRYRKKNGLEDLKKARKNLDWSIEEMEKEK